MNAQPLSFRWDAEFVARIDQVRGLVPRSTFVRAAVEDALAEHEGTVSAVALEAALSDDTQTGGPRAVDGHRTRIEASATGSVPARGASRPAASPRRQSHSVTCRCAMCKPPKAKS